MEREGLGSLALPHPRFRGGKPSSASPYKGEETQINEHFQFPHFRVSDG